MFRATDSGTLIGATSLTEDNRPSVCFVASSPFVVTAFLRDHFVELSKRYRVTVMTDVKSSPYVLDVPDSVTVIHVDIKREIAPIRDLAALFALCKLFMDKRFDVVHSITPKAGLLAMVAAFITCVPRRIHVFTGQVWSTKQGLKRWMLKTMDKLMAGCATHLLADSPSQRQFLVDEGIVRQDRIQVLANGSMAGVDLERFKRDTLARQSVRTELGIDSQAVVILFVGRLKREKGVPDLLAAWEAIKPIRSAVHLVLVGPDEEGLLDGLPKDAYLHAVGYTLKVERYMAAADMLVLPSYREGFGSVLLEAAATGLPVLASRIYGITDAVVEGETGLLHQAGDVAEIRQKLLQLIDDEQLRNQLGNAGYEWAAKNFSREAVTQAMVAFYARILASAN